MSAAPPRDIEKMAQEALDEARMVLPGMQALFGFQLIATFNERFKYLQPIDQKWHFAATLLTTIAIAIIMTPPAYHRQVNPQTVTKGFVKLASVLITAAMVPLMIALSIEVYILGQIVFESEAISLTIATIVLSIFLCFWFVFPQAARRYSSN
jgi:hypothetical protein